MGVFLFFLTICCSLCFVSSSILAWWFIADAELQIESEKALWLLLASSPAVINSASLPHSTPVPLFSILSSAPVVWLTPCHHKSCRFCSRKTFLYNQLTQGVIKAGEPLRCGFGFQSYSAYFIVLQKNQDVKGQRVHLISPILQVFSSTDTAHTTAKTGWQQLVKLCPFPVVFSNKRQKDE